MVTAIQWKHFSRSWRFWSPGVIGNCDDSTIYLHLLWNLSVDLSWVNVIVVITPPTLPRELEYSYAPNLGF